MKKVFIITMALVIMLGLTFTNAYANYNMSWNFQKFNNPNARQVANNRAKTQDGMIENQQDPLERFKESLERRLYSRAQREIVDAIMNEEDIENENFTAGDLDISIAEDPQTGEVLVTITDKISGDSTVITYSSDKWSY
ncbi:MAG: curli assembly protein CsgF [Halanaerobiales bacterium]|nr:curli assembly protein CsgF [Halanaerobiales bacterium]